MSTLVKIRYPQTCAGRDAGDGRCADCDLPMSKHPIRFYGKGPKV